MNYQQQKNVNWFGLIKKKWPSATQRSFKSFIGVSFVVLNVIYFTHLEQTAIEPIHLLWTLSFLRTYNTFDVLHMIWGVSRTTFQSYVWNTIDYLFSRMNYIHWGYVKRLGGVMFRDKCVIGAVDTFECNVTKPVSFVLSQKIYSGKKRLCTFKYQIVISLVTGIIFSLCGNYPGPKGDSIILKESPVPQAMEGLKREANLALWLFGDTAYSTHRTFCLTKRNFRDDATWNRKFHAQRNFVERVIGFMVRFAVLNQRFRHEKKKHRKITFLIAQICNLEIIHNKTFNPSKDPD